MLSGWVLELCHVAPTGAPYEAAQFEHLWVAPVVSCILALALLVLTPFIMGPEDAQGPNRSAVYGTVVAARFGLETCAPIPWSPLETDPLSSPASKAIPREEPAPEWSTEYTDSRPATASRP